MPYQPARTIVQSGFRNVKFDTPDINFGSLVDSYFKGQELKYKETNDYYDIQREEMNALASVLNGTYGADNKHLNEVVLQARDEMKAVFKNTRPRDYRNPEVQDKLFEIKNRVARAKNQSETTLKQITEAYTKAKATPSMIEGEVQKYLNAQLSLPPEDRDPDIINKVFTDPLFINAYDHLTSILDKRKTATKNIQKKDENFFYSYEATFRPDLGYFDENDNWVFAPKDEVIDEALSNVQFYNNVEGMLPASVVKEMKDKGHHNQLQKLVRERAKEYLNEVFVREEGGERIGSYDPKLVQKGRTLNPAKYARPTVSDKEKNAFEEEIGVIQQRLKDNNPLAFEEYLSPDGWRDFQFEYDENGEVIKIIGTLVDKKNILYGKTMGEQPTTIETIPVDPDDPGSVRQALSRIKFVYNTDKKKVTAAPLKKPEEQTKTKPKIKGF